MGKSKKRSRDRSRDRDEDGDINKRVCRLEHILGEFIKETREKIFSKKGNVNYRNEKINIYYTVNC